jgi:tripartite-type tricarboxylate transporter receptor subunit TctC
MQRRHVVRLLSAAGLAAPGLLRGTAAAAQGWPDRPVRIVVPYPPGGSNDTVARIIQPRLTEILGKPVIVENRAGASGSVGTTETARAAPDGYTWCLANDTLAANDTLLPLPYKSSDLTACSLLGTCPYALTVHPSLPYRTLADVVAAAKRQPESLNYATTGVGSLAHVATVLLEQEAGMKLVHVPYRGGAPALQDALAGHVPLFMSNIVIILPHIRAGALRAVGVSSARESRYLPGLPTFAAQGFPGFEALTYWVLVGPARVPDVITLRMQEAVAQALKDPAVQARMADQGADIVAAPPERTADFLAGEVTKWGAVIRKAGITMDGT